MSLILTEPEVRVFGVLVEKELATPDYYPMSLNALVNACNQKTNREPVVNYDEATVQAALESLRERGIGTRILGERVPKYGHRAYETLKLGRRELALASVLMLRGHQTAAELKERAQRMHDFDDLDAVEICLKRLADSGLAILLPRQPGQREARWAHLLHGEPTSPVAESTAAPMTAPREDRLAKLEAELAALRAEFDAFKQRFD